MRIEAFDRVEYEHNPLAEVVCQVAFEQLESLTDDTFNALRPIFAGMGYSETQQIGMTVGLPAGIVVAGSGGEPQIRQQVRVEQG